MAFENTSESATLDAQTLDSVPVKLSVMQRDPERLETHLEVERISRLLQVGSLAFVLEPVAAAVLAILVGHFVETKSMAIWLVLVWGASALRAILWHHVGRSDASTERILGWGRAYASAVTAGGALWATSILLMWPQESIAHQLILVAGLVGVAGVVAVSVASYMPAAVMYVLTCAAVALWGLLWHGVGQTTAVAATVSVIAVVLLLVRHINLLLRERSRLNFELIAAAEEGEAANRAKSQFIANMSHELRTPLNAILGFSELIRDEAFGPIEDDRYKSYATDIHNSGNHLLDVINDILDLSKIEAGKMELIEEQIDVGEVIGPTLNLVKDSAEKGGVTLKTILPDDSLSLVGDERALKQILLNLLANAIKFTPLGGEVVTEVKIAPSGDLVLLLRDNGIGMSQEDIPLAMTPFGQVDGSLARKFEGTGLGLPLVKTLVERHGGEFRLQSELGVGTTAIASFPADSVRRAA